MMSLEEKIGTILSDIKHLIIKVDSIDAKVESLQMDNIKTQIEIKNAHDRIDRIEPKVQDHEKIKQKGIGILAAISFLMGVLGSFVLKILSALI